MSASSPCFAANSNPVYGYVDGNYFLTEFRDMTRAIFGSDRPFTPQPLVNQLHQTPFPVEKVFVYDAVGVMPPPEVDTEKEKAARPEREATIARKKQWHDELRKQPGIHVVHGTATRRINNEQKTYFAEKEVDSLLAVDTIKAAARGTVRRMSILAGDLDMVPVIEALIDFGVYVKVVSFAWRNQPLLLQSADDRQLVSRFDLFQIAFQADPAIAQTLRFWNHGVPSMEIHKQIDTHNGVFTIYEDDGDSTMPFRVDTFPDGSNFNVHSSDLALLERLIGYLGKR